MTNDQLPDGESSWRGVGARFRLKAGLQALRLGGVTEGVAFVIFVLALILPTSALAQGNEAYRAYQMIQRAESYLEAGNSEQGVKLLQDVPRMFPTLEERFKARLVLGQWFVDQKQYDRALEEFAWLKKAEAGEVQAEGLYRSGICHYEMNDYDKAFVSLRKVTTDFPWSVWANEAYYYVGLCHFKMQRWTRAYEALKMVGVSVPTNVEETVGEAGRRIWVKVADRDLVTVVQQDGVIPVELRAKSGDREELELAVNGKEGAEFIGSLPSSPGAPQANDGVLQFLGGDKVEVVYVDETAGDGARNQQLLTTLNLASTASAGFTDGAYRDYVEGVRINHPVFLRVKDFDANKSKDVDKLTVVVRTEEKVEATDQDLTGVGVGEETEIWRLRDELKTTLTESEAMSGTFVGQVRPLSAGRGDGQGAELDDEVLHGVAGDRITLEYVDETRPGSESEAVVIGAHTTLLDESQQDVEITQWVVSDVELKARKMLIESQIFLKLGQIFKEVGLQEKADEKATEGLDRIEEVIRLAVNGNLPQTMLEETFNTKWDLQLVQNQLAAAVATCNTLLRMFPESRIADKALLQIGLAKLETEYPEDWQESLRVFQAVLRLTQSELKAEAQYRLAQAQEKIGYYRQRNAAEKKIPQQAIASYQKCADMYPESAFAGQSLEKVVQYHIDEENYQRAVDMMELIFQDFVDASFLDVMLLKWAIAAQKMGNTEVARQKLNRLIAEYPNSKVVQTAMRFRERL